MATVLQAVLVVTHCSPQVAVAVLVALAVTTQVQELLLSAAMVELDSVLLHLGHQQHQLVLAEAMREAGVVVLASTNQQALELSAMVAVLVVAVAQEHQQLATQVVAVVEQVKVLEALRTIQVALVGQVL